MQHAEFVHLHVHSEYSLLDGAAQLEKLVAKAKALKFPAIALTDHGNLFGAVDFYLAAQKAGVKPIIGCELYVAPGGRAERGSQDGGYEGANHLTVLVRNLAGYKNLIKLVSKAYLEGFYYKPRVDRELLAQHADGLLVLSGCLNSEVSRALSAGDTAKATQTAGWYQEVFGKDHYFMEVQAHGMAEQVKVTGETLAIAKAIGAPVAGTNDSHYLEAGHARAHEALLCIQTGSGMSDPNRWKFSTNEFYVKSADEMARVFADLPEACRNTLAVAERCNLTLEFGKFHLPRYMVPPEHTLETYLEELAREGLKRRYGVNPGDTIEARLAHELAVIQKMGFAGYFLVVWDFIHYARQHGVAVGPGRGSSAGSLVAYCLGITNVDPMKYSLLFERFLNSERITMPDMDIDFADDRRDEVIRYVADKYGRDRVAHIITFGTLGAKAAIRDVGRVLGMSYTDVDRIAKLVPGFPLNITLEDAYQKSPPLADAVKGQPAVKELWDIALALEGCTRHASVHASAVVISDEALDEHIPLYKDPKRPELITGYAMGPIEKLGLLKMDFLGLRTLTVLANTVQLIKESRGLELSLDALPLDDARTYALLSEAKTFGVFQLESSGMREALRGLRPSALEDVIAMVSLYRPGPMELIPDFIARKHGKAKITYEHPAMETFTRETYGIMVYQEQIMQIASEMGGFTMGEADTLRRAMGKKDRELMAKQREKFIAGCKERQTAPAKAERVWELMEKFAGYGFNKCLTADTMIEMADGTRKPITAVRDGDRVLTKDGPFEAKRVRPSGVRPVGRLRLANGMAVRCTPDHPVFTQRGWVNAEKLLDSDAVAVLDVLAAADLRVAARRRVAAGLPATAEGDVPLEWSAPTAFTPDGVEPTYDFEVPKAESFIANGIAVHNSHAAAYALVAYQTAYFKANYPVEFMAALLTSEMGDTDKIVKYIDECRAMGIRVQPPDVNVSQVRFSVAGDTIHFGLAAIKNVGEAAMESILRTRAAEGDFKTLEDFCVRVDLRLVNRRVIESLIKAGAFDTLGLPRAHLLAQCDVALESGQRQQREKAEGQGSFFDLMPAAAPAPRASEPATAVVPEWDDDQRLAYEKEVLGFYVSGHPLARFEGVAESLGVTSSAELANRSHGARVTLFGHVAAIKETATKSGNRMAFLTLEDMAGTVDVTVFPEPYKAAAMLLRAREPVVIRGRVDDSDKGRVVLAEDVRPLEQSMAAGGRARNGGEPTACRVRVRAGETAGATLAALRRLCEEHAGTVPVFLHLLLPGHEVVVRARGVAVEASGELVAKLETLLGAGAAVIEHAGRA
ncbi:MAG: DNA polymerase III subunit alpha [Candidatus Rokuibacteriota bacterium]|nr:MAG: DNA polymerase III subunit alpha [Candidatus Rokubacteria bacterium]